MLTADRLFCRLMVGCLPLPVCTRQMATYGCARTMLEIAWKFAPVKLRAIPNVIG